MRARPTALLVALDGVIRGADAALALDALDLVRELRAAGVPVVLAAPACDEAAELGLVEEFDAIADSAAPGAAKPSRAFFTAACGSVGAAPARCLLVDVNDRDVRGARAAGLAAIRWTGPADAAYVRAAFSSGSSPAA